VVIGKNIVLDSDIEKFKLEIEERSEGKIDISDCEMLEELMQKKITISPCRSRQCCGV
jgi:hypothetical protein